MIDIRKLKELVRLMVANDLTEIDLRDSEEQVTLRRPSQHEGAPVVQHAPTAAPQPAAPSAQPAPQPAPSPATPEGREPASSVDEEGLVAIESPMVGTFYEGPDPDSPPFVKVGDRVEPETIVCLGEAMKNFIEIRAEVSGTIAKVLVKNGDSIEFGQKLFLVKPD